MKEEIQYSAEGDEFGEFENFACDEGELMALPNAWAKDPLSGDYTYVAMRMAWRAWKARAALASKDQPKGTSKCDCTAYCGQYLMQGHCRAHPASVVVTPVVPPVPLSVQAPAVAPEDAKDAARWRAFINCARIRFFGWAGLDKNGDPTGEHVHFGAEFWTHHEARTADPAGAAKVLTNFADAALASHPPVQSTN